LNNLNEIIRREIATRGIISFARFMELALYCPVYGFYEQEGDTIGRRGHYYTNVSTGKLFGELLAFQFAEWLAAFGVPPSGGSLRPDRLKAGHQTEAPACQIVEAGAHDGRLAKDILSWLRLRRPELFEKIAYWIVEPSARRQEWQRETLKEFAPRIRWLAHLEAPCAKAGTVGENWQLAIGNWKSSAVQGVIFSNELLDAMPVHRFGWDAGEHKWFAWGVTIVDGKFVWTRLGESTVLSPQSIVCTPPRSADSLVRETARREGDARTWLSALRDLPRELLDVLPDGFTTEVCPAAEAWWRTAAAALARGKLLTIDYGLTGDEWFAPERRAGTLRAYHHHHLSSDVLQNPGAQDMTAHVNFTALQRAGEAAGLQTDGLFTQPQFLTKIAERVWRASCQNEFFGGTSSASPKLGTVFPGESGARVTCPSGKDLRSAGAGEWAPDQTRQFQTLIHPEHLGRSFRVLVQSR